MFKVPETQTPETPPELDPNSIDHGREGQGLNDTDEHEEQSGSGQPDHAKYDKILKDLIDPAIEDDEPDEDDDGTSKNKKKRLTKRLRIRRKKAVRNLSDIFAESRKKQKRYKDMLKSSFQEGKRKALEDKEVRRNREKRRSRIINAIKRNRARRHGE